MVLDHTQYSTSPSSDASELIPELLSDLVPYYKCNTIDSCCVWRNPDQGWHLLVAETQQSFAQRTSQPCFRIKGIVYSCWRIMRVCLFVLSPVNSELSVKWVSVCLIQCVQYSKRRISVLEMSIPQPSLQSLHLKVTLFISASIHLCFVLCVSTGSHINTRSHYHTGADATHELFIVFREHQTRGSHGPFKKMKTPDLEIFITEITQDSLNCAPSCSVWREWGSFSTFALCCWLSIRHNSGCESREHVVGDGHFVCSPSIWPFINTISVSGSTSLDWWEPNRASKTPSPRGVAVILCQCV